MHPQEPAFPFYHWPHKHHGTPARLLLAAIVAAGLANVVGWARSPRAVALRALRVADELLLEYANGQG